MNRLRLLASTVAAATVAGCFAPTDPSATARSDDELAEPAPATLASDANPAIYPVIIVGSGYGGSVAAYNLSQRRIPNLVLERGRSWKVGNGKVNEPFPIAARALQYNDGDPTTELGDARVGWRRPVCGGNLYLTFPPGPENCTPTTGLLELVNAGPQAGGSIPDASPRLTAKGISTLVAAGVGGGSLVNNGVTFAPTKLTWDVAFPPAKLPHMQQVWQDLERVYFRRALTRLGATPPPADILATPYYEGTRSIYDFFGKLGYRALDPRDVKSRDQHRSLAPVIVNWDAVRDEVRNVRVPSVINGEAWWGINSGAKKSLDTDGSYLGSAIATGLTRVKPLHTVADIRYDPTTRLYALTVVHTDEAYKTLETLTYKTPSLVMAAGSIGTTKLLLRARERGTLPRLSPAVGTLFSNNGNMGGFLFLKPESNSPANALKQGGPAGVKILDTKVPGNPVVLENLPGPQPAALQARPELQRFYGATTLVGIGVPKETGTFTYDATTDAVTLNWPEGAAHNVYERVHEIWSQHPGYLVPQPDGSKAPVLSEERATANTLHPLGGVPLGVATDLKCALRGYDGLYAVDGSLVPGASAVANPSGLITALAERCLDQIGDEIAIRAQGVGRPSVVDVTRQRD